MEVESILIDETKIGQASRQLWSGDFDLPSELGLQSSYHSRDVIGEKDGVRADCLSERDTTHFGRLRHTAA